MVHRQNNPAAAEPAQGFVLLLTGLGDIFRPKALLPYPGMIRLDDDPMSPFGIIDSQHGGHLHVVRQQGDQGIGIGAGAGFKGNRLDSEVLPLRDGTGVQDTQRILQGHGRDEALQRVRLPVAQVLPGIEGDAGLGQPEIGRRQVRGRPVGGMHAAHPRSIPEGRGIEPQLRLSAAQMRESVLAEVPEQQGHLVLPFPEIRGQVHFVKIAVLRIGAALEASFEDGEFSVHPEPVLAVHGDPGRDRCRNGVQPDILPESDPLVRGVRHTGTAQGTADFDGHLLRRLP